MAKPVYNAVVGHAASAPTVVFVPSRKQCQLTAIDLMTYASASGSPGRFCTASEERMAPVLESIKDPALKQTLGHGVGFVHPGLAKSDRERVEAFLRREHDGLPILLHPHTVDGAVADHTRHARWVGEQLPILLDRL